MSIFGTGPAHTNGTRTPHAPAVGSLGKTRSQINPKGVGDPPDLAGAGAPCTRPEADPDLWHPNGYGTAEREQAAEAIALCNRCRVQAECREWADVIKATHGIWGGEWLDLAEYRRRRSA